MKIIEGDLLELADDGAFDVIVHGCNCFCNMGAGIAKQIRKKWPLAFEADMATPKGDREKLGLISHCAAKNKHGNLLFIVNAYTQFDYDRNAVNVDYEAIKTCFRDIKTGYPNHRIGYPLIGAGLAGGDWNLISPNIDAALDGLDHTLVVLPGTDINNQISITR